MSFSINEGIIIKSVSGLFIVESASDYICCKARGIFRQRGIEPCAGDRVTLRSEDNSETVIVDVAERKNHLDRPAIANVDAALLVISTCEPKPNTFVIDKLITVFEGKGIEPVLIFTKKDKLDGAELISVYEKIGFRCFSVDSLTCDGTEAINELIKGKTNVLVGNSGVGKSSLLNAIMPDFHLKTDIISKKLGRGKHTTRTVELYPLENGGYIADTPGFSTVDVSRLSDIPSAELHRYFREFEPFEKDCRFDNCKHLRERDCGVRQALNDGKISVGRYESYEKIYDDIKKSENTY